MAGFFFFLRNSFLIIKSSTKISYNFVSIWVINIAAILWMYVYIYYEKLEDTN